MALKDLLVHVDSGTETAQQVAIALAVAHGAHLVGLHVISKVEFPNYSDARIPQESIRGNADTARARVDQVRASFLQMAEARGCEPAWNAVLGTGSQPLTDAARYVDLVIVDKMKEERLAGMPLISNGELIERCSRAVLVVPPGIPTTILDRHIVIAWDGGRQSTRAINDALPLLERAHRITLVAVNPAAGDESLADIRAHLGRHGIDADTRRVVNREAKVSSALSSIAADLGADLIVMGAYNHTRLRETLLGGTTREMLRDTPVPVLMAH
mgnify:CR=1 FL=1